MKIPLRANLTFLWLCCQKPDTDCFSCFVEEWKVKREKNIRRGEKGGIMNLVFNFFCWKTFLLEPKINVLLQTAIFGSCKLIYLL